MSDANLNYKCLICFIVKSFSSRTSIFLCSTILIIYQAFSISVEMSKTRFFSLLYNTIHTLFSSVVSHFRTQIISSQEIRFLNIKSDDTVKFCSFTKHLNERASIENNAIKARRTISTKNKIRVSISTNRHPIQNTTATNNDAIIRMTIFLAVLFTTKEFLYSISGILSGVSFANPKSSSNIPSIKCCTQSPLFYYITLSEINQGGVLRSSMMLHFQKKKHFIRSACLI